MLALVLAISVFTTVFAFDTGGPQKSCVDSFPHHHGDPQYDEGPYRINLNATSYSPGDVIQVTLTTADGTPFKGFQVRANKVTGDKEDLIGQFIAAPNNTRLMFWYPKVEGEMNCATHNEISPKESVTLLWKAPVESAGDIFFRSGFVKNYDVFWPSVKSVVIKAMVPAQVIENNEVFTSVLPDPAFDAQCGVTKGCLLYPSTCSGSDCRFGVAYQPTEDGKSVIIELMGETDGYLSVAFSEDNKMGHDSVVTCFLHDNDVGFHHGYCPAYYCDRLNIDAIKDMAVKRENGKLFCRFTRPLNLTAITYKRNYFTGAPDGIKPVTFDLNLDWHVFLAWGHVYPGYDAWHSHDQLPLVSQRPVNVLKTEIASGQTLHLNLQLHATFGLLAWFALAGCSILLARHYKSEINKPVVGKPLWLQLHRLGMIGVFVFSAICIILIFVYLKKWTERAGLHAIFGLVAVGISLLQIVAGMCRPAPDATFRNVFNWAHMIGGLLAFVAAAVALFLGAQNILLHPSIRTVETIILTVGLFFQVFWVILLDFKQVRTDNGAESNSKIDNVNEMNGVGKMETEEPAVRKNGNLFKWIVVLCFLLTTLVTVVLAICAIFELF